MPSYGNATIGEVLDPRFGSVAAQSPIAINAMSVGAQAGMLNAHIGQNGNMQEPNPVRALQLGADGTPGIGNAGAKITWLVPPGAWVAA